MYADEFQTKVIEPEIITGDKINHKIIKEQKVITGNDINILISILSVPKKEGDSYGASCFDPHHAIFIIRKDKISYIDLCFHCTGAATSEDLTDIRPLGDSKFVQLLAFFRRLKLDYKLPETIYPTDM